MSFWSTSTGEDLSKTEASKEYEAPTIDDNPIPDGSTVQAFIKEAKWAKGQEKDGSPRYINIQWTVEKPESVARRVVFQKLWVKDPDPNAKTTEKADKKRDNALKMLETIDANARGKLKADGVEPNDDQLALALNSAQMLLHLKVWDMPGSDGKKMSGNWVAAINPIGAKDLNVPEVEQSGGVPDLDDDIPF